MNKIRLFCDGSVNPQKKIGFAAYFIYDENLKTQDIKIKKFEDTSSTKLELESLLWALEDERLEKQKVIVYTDCQNILSLIDREEKLKNSSYMTKNGKTIRNHKFYKRFYEKCEFLDLEIIKVKGHKKSSLKDEIDELFNLVDKASRNELRKFIAN